MWQKLKCLLYDLIVWSHVLYYIGPYLFLVLQKFLVKSDAFYNHEETDEAGHKLRMTSFNNRNYAVVSIDKLCSIPDIKIRKDDVMLCSYPKAGCHWVYEIIHMLVTGKIVMTKIGKECAGGIDFLPNIYLESIPSPRVLNSHLLFQELPTGVIKKEIKIILLVRNPKDIVVSFFNYHKKMKNYYGYDGDFNGYFQMFMNGRLEFGSYFDYILNWDKVMKEETNNQVLLITYEDLKEKSISTVLRVASFLNLDVSKEFVEKVIVACDFEKMKRARSMHGQSSANMYRKGSVGDWKNWLTDAQSEAIDREWQERMLGCVYKPKYCIDNHVT